MGPAQLKVAQGQCQRKREKSAGNNVVTRLYLRKFFLWPPIKKKKTQKCFFFKKKIFFVGTVADHLQDLPSQVYQVCGFAGSRLGCIQIGWFSGIGGSQS